MAVWSWIEEKTLSHQSKAKKQSRSTIQDLLESNTHEQRERTTLAKTWASLWKTVNRDGMCRAESPTSHNSVHNSVCCPNTICPMTRLSWGKDGRWEGLARRNSSCAPEWKPVPDNKKRLVLWRKGKGAENGTPTDARQRGLATALSPSGVTSLLKVISPQWWSRFFLSHSEIFCQSITQRHR